MDKQSVVDELRRALNALEAADKAGAPEDTLRPLRALVEALCGKLEALEKGG